MSAAEYARRRDAEAQQAGADPSADAAADPSADDARAPGDANEAKTADAATGRPFPEGLDARVRNAVVQSGITSLYPPQREALDAILEGRNVLVSIPTASGKSLIAHMGILHHLVSRGGKALFIVPLRALASEKFEELRELCLNVPEPRLKVGIATGDLDERDDRLARFDIIVTTSEKADSLMRHSAGWMDDLSVVVADEVHLLGDSGRGPTLEVTLARLKARGRDLRFIALSATIGNARTIARWLDADLVTSTWRPVALKEGIFHDGNIEFADGTIRPVAGKADKVVRLVEDTVVSGAQSLVFVNTRRSTEATALKVAKALKPALDDARRKVLEEAAARIAEEEGETSRLGGRLADALRGGAAFHHAGLSTAQRRVVEGLFKARQLGAIVATPTLAAGVNLPARRVIVRDLYRFEASFGGNAPLSVMEVKQMTGRAGRPRYDPFGEAVLIARTEEERDRLMMSYLLGEPEDISSYLGQEAALRMHLLAGIATGFTPDMDAVQAFIDSTFLAHDPAYGERWTIGDRVEETLRFLIENDFIHRTEGGALSATPFGRRVSELYVDPQSALKIRDGLTFTRRVPQVDDLALLALVASTPDVMPLYLKKNDEWVEQVAAENEGRWLCEPFRDAHEREYFLADLKTALLLQDWINEHRLEHMESKYGIGPGDIQNRAKIAEWMLYAAEEIARLDRDPVGDHLKRLKLRMHHGAKEELLAILRFKGIGRYRARVLVQHGFRDKAKLQKASVERLLSLPGFGPRIVQSILKELDREVDLGEIKRAERDVRVRKEATGSGGPAAKQDPDAVATATTGRPAGAKQDGPQRDLFSFGKQPAAKDAAKRGKRKDRARRSEDPDDD